MKIFKYVTIILISLSTHAANAGFDHSLFDDFLKEHVKVGLVDYENAKQDERLDAYLLKVTQVDLATLGNENERMSFFINAYNAYTIKLVTSAYPVKSIRLINDFGKSTKSFSNAEPWKIRFANIGGKYYSLDEIEHEILLKEFNEPRIHFAIVCAAISCPILRSEAYIGTDLDNQLNAQGRWFFSWRNQFDLSKKQARLSKILEWFADDFGGTEAILSFATPYVNASTAKSLKEDLKSWSISYQVYDWKLNSQK